MARISDTRRALIGALSLRWPPADTALQWQYLHDVINTARRIVVEADQKIETITRDADLSEAGRIRKIGDAALAAIAELQRTSGLAKAERTVEQFLERMDVKAANEARPNVSEVLKAQIRDGIAKQRDPLLFLQKHLNDDRFVVAIEEAPSFLSGLTDEQKNIFLNQARQTLNPDAVARRQQHESAVNVAREAVAQAEKMIADIGQLRKHGSEWVHPQIAA